MDDGNAYVYVGGNVYAKATGTAQGAHLFGESGVSGTIAGDVTAKSSDSGAFGVILGDDTGAASVVVDGNVLAVSATSQAVGVIGYVYGSSVYVGVGGDVTANGVTGATGVRIYALNSDDAIVHVTGNVTAYASKGDATGVRIVSDAYTYIGGNATAMTPTGNATAVYINSAGYAGVHVGHNVYAGCRRATPHKGPSGYLRRQQRASSTSAATSTPWATSAPMRPWSKAMSASRSTCRATFTRTPPARARSPRALYSVSKSGSNGNVYVGGNVTAIAFGYAQGVNVSGESAGLRQCDGEGNRRLRRFLRRPRHKGRHCRSEWRRDCRRGPQRDGDSLLQRAGRPCAEQQDRNGERR